MNNRVTITFSRDFVAGDSIGVYYSDPSTQTSGYWTFTWVNGTPGAFEVQVGTPTSTAGEIEAIRFASAWSNSLNGFTVTQPVSGNDNQVQITSQTYHFVNVLAKFANGNTMAIPTHYNYALSTVSTGNKITYTDKEPLNTPAAPAINLWKADDANEVKTKFNLNDDRIGTLETDMLGKADLVGGNDFTGDQTIDGHIKLEDHLEIRDQNTAVSDEQNLIGVEFYTSDFSFNPPSPLERATTPIGRILPVAEHPNGDSYGLTFYTSDTDSESVEGMRLTSQGNVGIGITSPSEKLEVAGNIKLGTGGNSGTIDIDGSWNITHGSAALYFKQGNPTQTTYFTLSPTGHSVTGNTTVEGNIYERFNITDVTTNAHTLSDTDRMIFYKYDGDGTLTIPSGLSNKVWEIVNTDDGVASTKTFDINGGGGVTLDVVKSYQNNQSEILRGYTGKLVRTGTNAYTLIKY